MLIVMRLQVSSATKRDVAEATGTIGRPDRRASVTMPRPALRAGPGGTSAVMTTEVPDLSARAAWRRAAAPPLSLRRAPAPAPRISSMPKLAMAAPMSSASPWRATIAATLVSGVGLKPCVIMNWPCQTATMQGCSTLSRSSVSGGS